MRAVFESGELARLAYSADNRFPGLFASANVADGTYMSTLGVRPLASQVGATELSIASSRAPSQPIVNTTLITPYGAYVAALLFPDDATPLRWLAAMLSAERMQSRFGVVESLSISGPLQGQVASMVTWDTKVTTSLALCGGAGGLVACVVAAALAR